MKPQPLATYQKRCTLFRSDFHTSIGASSEAGCLFFHPPVKNCSSTSCFSLVHIIPYRMFSHEHRLQNSNDKHYRPYSESSLLWRAGSLWGVRTDCVCGWTGRGASFGCPHSDASAYAAADMEREGRKKLNAIGGPAAPIWPFLH